MALILIIDDDELICEMLARLTVRMGHEVRVGHTCKEYLEAVEANPPDVILLDIRLPDGNSFEILDTIREAPSSPTVIIMTAYVDPRGAELAMKSEAWDYIAKPSSTKELMLPLVRALQYREERNNSVTKIEIKRDGIVGNSPRLKDCLELVRQAANSDLDVLITGETGTGKELFASSIHNNSKRSMSNFVVVDCASLPEPLVESILFGHLKGTFTGADRAREGLIQQAHGGTLFLDEIGELPLSLQKRFLRVVQEHRFRPLGSQKELESDFRLISATNRDLDGMVERGEFRNDLLYRIRAISIALPPLRAYVNDVRALVEHYIDKICTRFGVAKKKVSDDFYKCLEVYQWPGNVRELGHVIERACAAALHEETLFPVHLPQALRISITKSLISRTDLVPAMREERDVPSEKPLSVTLKKFREITYARLEEQYLLNIISSQRTSIKEACIITGLSRARLYGLLKKHNIKRP